MSPALLSLLALIAALAVSMTSRINVGWLGLVSAWLIGIYAAGLRPEAVLEGFPTSLFITLTGVTLLFAIAETNHSLGARAAARERPRRRGAGADVLHRVRAVVDRARGRLHHGAARAAGDGDGAARRRVPVPDGADGGQRGQRR